MAKKDIAVWYNKERVRNRLAESRATLEQQIRTLNTTIDAAILDRKALEIGLDCVNMALTDLGKSHV
jgi:hypothetical protein